MLYKKKQQPGCLVFLKISPVLLILEHKWSLISSVNGVNLTYIQNIFKIHKLSWRKRKK